MSTSRQPPLNTPLIDDKGMVHPEWRRWLDMLVKWISDVEKNSEGQR